MATTDRLEIADLFARLAYLLDEARYDDLPGIYHADVVVHSPRGGVLRGLEEVTDFVKASHVEGVRTQHVHGDVLVQVDGDRATATANQLVFFYREGEPPHRNSGLRVSATALRTPEGWRIGETRIALSWMRED
ncbi:nuclear transport factor 2 family protein [Amycolatopsis magusensis]|uniref:nuclear transport factor 2 family protein n=1 Tax=Amycolatopsis magusensis TaxID=882444 RepID=UPI003C2D9529